MAGEGAVGLPAVKRKHVYTEADASEELFGCFKEDSADGEEVSEEVAQERAEAVLEELATGDGLQLKEMGGGMGRLRRIQRMYTYLDQFG